MWIIDHSLEVHKLLTSSKNSKPKNIITYDFSTLYTSIPHEKLKEQIKLLIHKAFHGMNKVLLKLLIIKLIGVTRKLFLYCILDEHSLTLLIDWLIDNTYVEVGNIILW